MKIALIGYGKMGRAIEEAVNNYNLTSEEPVEIVLKFNRTNFHELHADTLQQVDVAIEFTSPATAEFSINTCIKANIPVVVGTTGWYDHLQEVIAYAKSKNAALLYAPNFSIGVNLFFELNKKLAEMMAKQKQYQVHIEETHHTEKKDAPSGTAIKLAEQVIKRYPEKKAWVIGETEDENKLEVYAHRITDVPGTHQVIYDSQDDEIMIQHTAHSRKGFAKGALQAALWLKGKTGVFTMKDVLGI